MVATSAHKVRSWTPRWGARPSRPNTVAGGRRSRRLHSTSGMDEPDPKWLAGRVTDSGRPSALCRAPQELSELERPIAPVRGVRHRHLDGHRRVCLSPSATSREEHIRAPRPRRERVIPDACRGGDGASPVWPSEQFAR